MFSNCNEHFKKKERDLQISMYNSLGVKVFNCFEDLEDDETGVEFIKTFLMHLKDEVVEITTAEEMFENKY
jgi:hypothetical protein